MTYAVPDDPPEPSTALEIAHLPPDRAAELGQLGANLVVAGVERPEAAEAMLDAARQTVTDQIVTTYAGAPTPFGATRVLPWSQDGDNPAAVSWSRHFEGKATEVAGVHLLTAGFQWADNQIQRWASITVTDGYAELDAAELRRFAGALLDAADDLDE